MWVEGESTREANELFLTYRQSCSALVNGGRICGGEAANERIQIDRFRSSAHQLVSDRFIAEPDIARDISRKERRVLQHHSEIRTELSEIEFTDVYVIK